MTAPRMPRVRPILTACQASPTGCAGNCEQGDRCPDGPPMTTDDFLCAVMYVAVIAVLVLGAFAWRVLS